MPNIVVDLLLPPVSLAVLAFLLLRFRWRRLGLACLGVLILLGIPAVATSMLAALDPPVATPAEPPQAIVILSGDSVLLQDPADLDPGLLTLERLRAGAALHRRTGLPILVTGGPDTPPVSLAAMMARSLQQDFQVPVRWTEPASNDTWQNAEFTAAILRPEGITRVYVVTQGWHMRRALLAFRHFGLQATPAPVRRDLPQLLPRNFMPRASAWLASYYALHETVGLLFYALRG